MSLVIMKGQVNLIRNKSCLMLSSFMGPCSASTAIKSSQHEYLHKLRNVFPGYQVTNKH